MAQRAARGAPSEGPQRVAQRSAPTEGPQQGVIPARPPAPAIADHSASPAPAIADHSAPREPATARNRYCGGRPVETSSVKLASSSVISVSFVGNWVRTVPSP